MKQLLILALIVTFLIPTPLLSRERNYTTSSHSDDKRIYKTNRHFRLFNHVKHLPKEYRRMYADKVWYHQAVNSGRWRSFRLEWLDDLAVHRTWSPRFETEKPAVADLGVQRFVEKTDMHWYKPPEKGQPRTTINARLDNLVYKNCFRRFHESFNIRVLRMNGAERMKALRSIYQSYQSFSGKRKANNWIKNWKKIEREKGPMIAWRYYNVGGWYDAFNMGLDSSIGLRKNFIYAYDPKRKNDPYPMASIDHSLSHPEDYPPELRVWNGTREKETIEYLPMIDEWNSTVYNKNGVFIYVYDFDLYRKRFEDWHVHDRMLFGYEETTKEDMHSPWEKHDTGKDMPNKARLTWGPVTRDANHESLRTIRAFADIRMQKAFDRITRYTHPAPRYSEKAGDYVIPRSTRSTASARVSRDLILKYSQFANRESQFENAVKSMVIYDYWKGLEQKYHTQKAFDKNAYTVMARYAKGTRTLEQARAAARKHNLAIRYRDLYWWMAGHYNTATRQRDMKRYMNNQYLSIGIWAGSMGHGYARHRQYFSMKTAFPYFEGRNRPGKMGIFNGRWIEKKYSVPDFKTYARIMRNPNRKNRPGITWYKGGPVLTKTYNRRKVEATNTGGIVFGGYIDGNQFKILRRQYGGYQKLWQAAVKGPYVIISKRALKRYGKEYFEKKAGRKLAVADITGALIDQSAKVHITKKSASYIKKIRDRDDYRTCSIPAQVHPRIVDHGSVASDLSDQYPSSLSHHPRVSWKHKTRFGTIKRQVDQALQKDQKAYPGLSLLRMIRVGIEPGTKFRSVYVYPRKNRGLSFLNVVKFFKDQNLMGNLETKFHFERICKIPPKSKIEKLRVFLSLYFPAFSGNPHLFLVYYNNIEKLMFFAKADSIRISNGEVIGTTHNTHVSRTMHGDIYMSSVPRGTCYGNQVALVTESITGTSLPDLYLKSRGMFWTSDVSTSESRLRRNLFSKKDAGMKGQLQDIMGKVLIGNTIAYQFEDYYDKTDILSVDKLWKHSNFDLKSEVPGLFPGMFAYQSTAYYDMQHFVYKEFYQNTRMREYVSANDRYTPAYWNMYEPAVVTMTGLQLLYQKRGK